MGYGLSKLPLAHLLFTGALETFRPTCMLLPLRYETNLAERIKTTIKSNKVVLKVPDQSEGKGVIVIGKDQLEALLPLLLYSDTTDFEKKIIGYADKQLKTALTLQYVAQNSLNLDKIREMGRMIAQWRKTNSSVFLVEEYCTSKPLSIAGKTYDSTMRVAFVIKTEGETNTFIPLGCYWKLPEKPLGEGELREHSISQVNSNPNSSAKVSNEDRDKVYSELNKCLPAIFTNLLVLDMHRHIQTLLQSTDKQNQDEAANLSLQYANSLARLNRFEEARQIFKSFKKQTLAKNIDYYHQKGIYHFLQGNDAQALTKFGKVIASRPNHNSAFFRRAEVYIKLKRFKEAAEDLKSAEKCGFDAKRISSLRLKMLG